MAEEKKDLCGSIGKTEHNIFGLINQLLKKERTKVALLVIPLSEKLIYLFSQNILCLEIKNPETVIHSAL